MRIAVVDDHRLICDVLRSVCAEAGHDVVCVVDSGADAVRWVASRQPDLVILDLMLPDIDGFAVADRILEQPNQPKILAISARCDAYTVYRVQKSHFHGFIDKGSSIVADVWLALAALAAGQTWFSRSFARRLQSLCADSSGFARILSERQLAVLEMVGDGLDDAEIASRMGVKPAACEKARYRIRQRLGLGSRQDLYRYARIQGVASFASFAATKNPRGYGVV